MGQSNVKIDVVSVYRNTGRQKHDEKIHIFHDITVA